MGIKKGIITDFSSGTPSSTYSVAAGYSVGSEWVNTNNGNRFYHKTDGNWVPLNEPIFYIQGGTLSAFDTTSNIYRTGSLNIGTGTASDSRFVVSSSGGTNSLVVGENGRVSISGALYVYSTQSGAFRLQDGTQGNNYILTSDSNGVATWTPLSSIGISGASGSIPKFTGTSSLGNSRFYEIGTTGYYGSGSSYVSFLTGGNTWLTLNRSQSSMGFILGNPQSPTFQVGQIQSTNTIGLSVESAGYTSFNTGPTYLEKMRITSDGNVGIGLTAPSTKLHIYATQSGVFRLVDGTQGNGYVLISDSNGVASWTYSSGASIKWYIENTTPPATAPVATGAGSIAIGNNAKALSSNMFVYGESAGLDATGSDFSNFLGYYAGFQTYTSLNTNAIGNYAGFQSSNSGSSNFIGDYAGFQSTGSIKSNFFGDRAGLQSPGSEYSNFIGGHAGVQSPNTGYSNFFGRDAGHGAGGASYSNFFGRGAGQGSTGAYQSNFIGDLAGHYAVSAYNSNFFGNNAGSFANTANNSVFIGERAGYYASGAYNSNFFGKEAGSGGIYPYSFSHNSNFFGNNAGQGAVYANNSNFIGERAGKGSKQGNNSNFLGQGAGQINESDFGYYDGIYYYFSSYYGGNYSNFIGTNAGLNSVSNYSNFYGQNSGELTFLAHYSNFFGFYAGAGANSAAYSNFFGYAAGQEATNAYNSNLFGYSAGKSFTSNVIGANNIVIGTNISLPNGTTNGINIGGIIFGQNTYSNTSGDPSIVAQTNLGAAAGEYNGRIGINVVNPTRTLHVYSPNAGAIRLEDGSQGVGKVLTSDADGVGSWTSTLAGLSLLGNSEVISTAVIATASVVVYDYSLSSLWYHGTASSNFTANFTNLPTTDNRVLSASIVINQGLNGYIPNIVQIEGVTQSVKWPGGTQSGTSYNLDIVTFNFIRTSGTWTNVIGQVASFT